MGKLIFCEQNNFQVTKRGRYLAKYRPNFLGTQFACLRPERSETVSSPSDSGDWIIQSTPWAEGEFKTGLIQLPLKDYLRKLESGRILNWAN